MAHFCGKCGAPIPPDAQFCEECGEPVLVEAPSPPPQPKPAAVKAPPVPPSPSAKSPAPAKVPEPAKDISGPKKPLPVAIIGIAAVVIIIVIAAIILFSGAFVQETVTGITNGIVPTTSPTQAVSLEPGPVGTVPAGNEIVVQVTRDPYSGVVNALFAGGPGQKTVRLIEVTVMRQDGTILSGTIKPVILSEVSLQGTRRGTDRVIVTVHYLSDEKYVILDRQFDMND